MVPHLGGKALEPNSQDYRTLVRWIGQGAPPPNPKDPSVVRLIASPQRRILQPKQGYQIQIFAEYSDKSRRDITAQTRISSLNDTIAEATPEGRVLAKQAGATAIMLRYAGLATVSHVVVPYRKASPLPTKAENFIDLYTAKRWSELGLRPSPLCSDTEFLRRVSLDLTGTLPTPETIREFLADRSPNKRTKRIEALLESPEYALYWTLKWNDLLRNSRTTLQFKGMWSLWNWIYANMHENRPYDQFVREILTAQGGSYTVSPTSYFRTATTPQDLTETTTQLFLGVRLQCAKCHQHPFEKWSQRDYYQFAAFFARVGMKENLNTKEPSLYLLKQGETYHPKTGERMNPTPLAFGKTLPTLVSQAEGGEDRRIVLAEWLTSPTNLPFAKTLVNRYWGALMGRGIVHPVDDMRVTNPPSNPELLEALAKDFIAHGFNLKHLLRTICTSKAYQRSASATPANRNDEVFYSHFLPKRLSAEVLLDALSFATGVPEKFAEMPLGTRALQLPDALVGSAFLDTFGRPARSTVCECERASEPNLAQALQMITGEGVNRKLSAPQNRIQQILQAGKSDKEAIEELYLVTLSRPPSQSEEALAKKAVLRATDRRTGLEDLLWVLLNRKEFITIR
jgi:hypothetical protein